jgi:hypothetical protein
MALLSFIFEQLFKLLVPELVVWFEGSVVGVIVPSEPDFIENSLSILPHFVTVMVDPLPTNPPPQRLILLVNLWHHAMAIFLFKLGHLLTLLVPELVVSFEVEGAVIFPSETDFVQEFDSVRSHCVLSVRLPLISNPLP